jgi:hypothetical protein
MTKIGFNKEKIIQYFKSKNSDEDASYINKVFCDDEKEQDLKSLLSGQFDELLTEGDSVKKNLDHILYKIHYEINSKLSAQKTRKFDTILKWTQRLASIIVLPIVIFIGIHMYKESNLRNEAWVEIKSPAWSKVQFCLPDGTKGWLNSNSSIKYNGNFSTNRQLALKGEAFFDVFKDKNSPFIVTANDISVKVLGTRFNITSYENEKNIEVVLEEGKLVFLNKAKNKSYTMKPNDLVIYDKTHKDFTTEVVQSHKYVSWIEGKLIFRNDPLDVVANKLERWYNIDVDVNVSLAENLRLRATFIDESLEEVLDLMKRSLPIDYRIENGSLKTDGTFTKKKVIITPRNK